MGNRKQCLMDRVADALADWLVSLRYGFWIPAVAGMAVCWLLLLPAQYVHLPSWWAAFWGILVTWLGMGAWFARWKRDFLIDGVQSLNVIRAMSWKDFERLVAEAFRRQGYAVSENWEEGRDGGVDVRISRDGKKYLVQCKLWRRAVGVAPVRELWGVVATEKADGAFIVTPEGFTPDALQFARTSGPGLELIDDEKLIHLLGKDVIREVKVAQDAAEASGEATPPARMQVAPRCRRCGEVMWMAKEADGNGDAWKAWVCSDFKGCRTVQRIQ